MSFQGPWVGQDPSAAGGGGGPWVYSFSTSSSRSLNLLGTPIPVLALTPFSCYSHSNLGSHSGSLFLLGFHILIPNHSLILKHLFADGPWEPLSVSVSWGSQPWT